MSKSQESAASIQKIRLELEGYAQSLQDYRNSLQQIEAKLKDLSHFPIQETQALETPRNKKLVHCVLLTFYFNEILERCLEGLLPEKNRIDVSVIENSSINSDSIRKLVDSYREKGLVKNHFLFEENIGTNAFEIAFDSNLLDLEYQFITVTDGDLIPDKGWLDEQITILNQCPEVFSVSSELYYHNAPHRLRAEIMKIGIKSVNEIYNERLAGWWLKTFRVKDWKDFLAFRKKHKIFFHDRSAYDYGKFYKNQKSVLTLNSKSYHLTWDYANAEYLQLKKSLGEVSKHSWYQNKYSGFTLMKENSEELYFPSPPEVAHQKLSTKLKNTM
ncbi:glycosyltransferase family A protein [Okeania sp. SIO2B3]|uniref:glycosyltransferase family A protein n=1 Tax=Okeania sp. SIO2B3 TaxID=2607784 RepID=UPI0013BFB1BE|nr:glycosyltransferase family A protein [Okeania sp. SIO2B3]NET42670.1 glycosyltransferase family 2 protein [Okeania sp. SIO2B3]